MNIAIVGCRPPTFPNQSTVYGLILADVVKFISTIPKGATIMSGGAQGVDTTAATEAKKLGFSVVEYLPDYKIHGITAPLVRNTTIVTNCDEVHAWPAPWSRGTHDTIRKAKILNKNVTVHELWK